MTNSKDLKEDPSEKKPTGVIIDATSHRRSRLHQPEAEQEKASVNVDFLADVPLRVNVVLAGAALQVGEILTLGVDSVVQLDKPSGDPVDIYVENQKLGRGEVMVIQEKLRVRVLEITPPTSARPSEPTSEILEEE